MRAIEGEVLKNSPSNVVNRNPPMSRYINFMTWLQGVKKLIQDSLTVFRYSLRFLAWDYSAAPEDWR